MQHRNPDDAKPLWGGEEPPPFVVIRQSGTIQEHFEAFHRANPWVYDALVWVARDFLAGGASKVGIGMCYEVIRWSRGRRTSGDQFKVNNNFRSRYVRLIMEREEDLDGRFEIRRLTA